ncbi:hypothetical protein ACFXDE_03385 [Kitasatospora sp. NPDC059408]|uniref:hypothetical protein n=1 Tax=Kitasatospora sp. NPDC059408 TaxID=3346823 RepID=UPI0036ACD228
MTSRPPRRIRVDGRDYHWGVQVLDPGRVAVRVRLDGPGRRRQFVVSVEFDDRCRRA